MADTTKTPEELAAEEQARQDALKQAEATPPEQLAQEAPPAPEPKPQISIKQRDDLNRVLAAQNTNLKYDISEVLSKIPNNKGYGYSGDKVVFMAQDGDLLDSKEVMRTMDAGYKLTKDAYGEAVAKLSTNALARSADPGFKFTPDDVYNAWEKTAKTSGILAEDYDPETAVGVERVDATGAGAMKVIQTAVKTTSAQIENGTGFNQAVAYGLSMLSQDDSFIALSDPAKAYYAKQLVTTSDEVRKSAEGSAIVKSTQAWNQAEQQAHREIGGSISLLPEDFAVQLSPQEKLVAETNAATLLENSSKVEVEAVKLNQQAEKEEQDLGAIRRNYPQAIKGLVEKGLSEAEANIRLQNLTKEKEQTVAALRKQAETTAQSAKSYQQSSEKALSYATKGLPYGLKAKDTERIVGGIVGNIDALSSPIAMAEAMHVTGSRKETAVDYGSMNPADQYAFFLEHGVNQWLSDYLAKDPNKKEVAATIRANLMAEFNKKGSVAGVSPDMDTAIRRQMQNFKNVQSRQSSAELVEARTEKYDKFRSKFQTDFYKKMIEGDDPQALLNENKGYLDPKDVSDYEAFLKDPPKTFNEVMSNPKASRSMKKAALGELEKESATVAATVAESLKFVRGGVRAEGKVGLLKTADDAITAVVKSGLKNEHKAALIGLLAKNNEISGVTRGEFVDGYGFDRLYEMHVAATKATGVYGGWADFMDMYAALDRKLGGVAKNVTDTQKKEIVNTFIKEATDPLMNRMRAAAVSNLATGR